MFWVVKRPPERDGDDDETKRKARTEAKVLSSLADGGVMITQVVFVVLVLKRAKQIDADRLCFFSTS